MLVRDRKKEQERSMQKRGERRAKYRRPANGDCRPSGDHFDLDESRVIIVIRCPEEREKVTFTEPRLRLSYLNRRLLLYTAGATKLRRDLDCEHTRAQNSDAPLKRRGRINQVKWSLKNLDFLERIRTKCRTGLLEYPTRMAGNVE